MEGFLRAVEVVAELHVHPSTLRRFEARGVVNPLKDHRGIRFYTRDQVEMLKAHIRPRAASSGQDR